MRTHITIGISCLLLPLVLFGCSKKEEPSKQSSKNQPTETVVQNNKQSSNTRKPLPKYSTGKLQVIAQPDDISVLVNKHNSLPETFNPKDLASLNIPFLASASTEKRQLRKEAATQLEKMVNAAKKDNIYLKGVSGYRSHETQKALFNRYVKRDGYAKARTYSALPGTSEHETGLSIDITGKDGTCAADDCFAQKPEAEWLAKHVQDFGFIIRYPKGKEKVTGYKYEPWHIRYVGVKIAKELTIKGITLEEYYLHS
ncbi:M15 family metallopeptidase [Shimazuella kribbensis]|uniref:M15 family metallopeptidase n=1 Tax=Shimazuella kribbensis TaxID=139808 RepID=UPI0004066C22|nr:M15 family metallopeptidase [Shimazuella kribbensis]